MPFLTREQAAIGAARRLAQAISPKTARKAVLILGTGMREAARNNALDEWLDKVEETLSGLCASQPQGESVKEE